MNLPILALALMGLTTGLESTPNAPSDMQAEAALLVADASQASTDKAPSLDCLELSVVRETQQIRIVNACNGPVVASFRQAWAVDAARGSRALTFPDALEKDAGIQLGPGQELKTTVALTQGVGGVGQWAQVPFPVEINILFPGVGVAPVVVHRPEALSALRPASTVLGEGVTPMQTVKSEWETLTFARIVVDGSLAQSTGPVVGLKSPAENRLIVLNRLREYGLNVKGEENSVFGLDESGEARFVLGASLLATDCGSKYPNGSFVPTTALITCQVVYRWELLDRERAEVVYMRNSKVLAQMPASQSAALSPALMIASVDDLVGRDRFRRAIYKPTASQPVSTDALAPVKVQRCSSDELKLPEQVSQAMEGSAMIKSGSRSGAGAFISSDGFIITADHILVADAKTTVRLHQGLELRAEVIRRNKENDIALLKAEGMGFTCLRAEKEAPAPGSDVFAIGSPASEELAFSVSKGVVSGVREVSDITLIQTDVAVNRGNSGGPLINLKGELVGVVSWKLMGEYEGLSFAIPASAITEQLKVEWADESQDVSDMAAQAGAVKETVYPIVDNDD